MYLNHCVSSDLSLSIYNMKLKGHKLESSYYNYQGLRFDNLLEEVCFKIVGTEVK